jgi:hypothetical protein
MWKDFEQSYFPKTIYVTSASGLVLRCTVMLSCIRTFLARDSWLYSDPWTLISCNHRTILSTLLHILKMECRYTRHSPLCNLR